MAATTKNKSTKTTPEINHIHKSKRKKVTKGYKQRHSIGSRKTKVVTYSETYPIYESVLAIYLENSKKNQSSISDKPKEPVDKTPHITKPSTSNLNVTNDCCVILNLDINQPSASTVAERDNPMVGGKGAKPCISSKVKKDNMTSPKKVKSKPLKDENKKVTPKKEKPKSDKASPSKKCEKEVCNDDTKPRKDKKKKDEIIKKSKLKTHEKIEKKKYSPNVKKEKSKQLASTEDLISLLVNIKRESAKKSHKSKIAERKNQTSKVPKSPQRSNSPEKRERTKSPNKTNENKGEKAKKQNEENIQKGKKRKLDQNTIRSRDNSPVKAKSPKLDKDKSKKKDTNTKKSAKLSPKLKLKQKQKMEEKKKIKSEDMTKSLLDLFSSVKMKREASLNASARVNIMFEKIPPSPKPKHDLITKSLKCASDLTHFQKEKSNSEQKMEKSKKSPKDGGKKTPKKDGKNKSLKEKKSPKDKSNKAIHVKNVKDKSKVKKKDKVVAPEQSCMRRMASLNAQAIMAATKEFEAEASERAARIDRYCVAWQCEPLTTNVSSAAHWVDGLGKTCCVTQTNTCFTTATKPDTVTSDGPKLQAITESENVEERPASVVDVTTHVAPNPFLPLPPPQQCIGSFFSQSHSCVPPCSGCCGPEGYMSTSQFKSFQLGPLSSLNSLQMMTYGHPTHPGHSYRSAFSVPYNQVGMPHYGFYGNSYYQPTTGPVIQSDPCLMSHHVPVPQAQVKVLIHNPDSSLDHCAFLDKDVKESASEDTSQIPMVKRRSSSETKSKVSQEKSKPELKPKRKYERKQSKSPSKDEPEKKTAKIVKVTPEKPVIPAHGWSWFGEPESKNIPNVTEGPVRQRKCYPAMKHVDGDIINIRDCVLLRSGTRKKDIPFVAKVSALWENPEDGEIMMSLLWYYRPEHTEAGRKQGQLDNELFACKHRDENSVACIDDKGYVLTYNEYCRFKAEQRRIESHLPPRQNVVPNLEENGTKRKRLPPLDVNPDNVFLCRQVYDFRQHRILKNPS